MVHRFVSMLGRYGYLVVFVAGTMAIACSAQEVFHQPPEIVSANGVLETVLDAQPKSLDIGPQTHMDVLAFNGEYAGPVLRVHPGDVMKITLLNHTPDPINVHYHGLNVSPLGNSDNVHIVVQPGDRFDYKVHVLPTQAPGLYWYHDHVHGTSDKDIMAGLSGALIVEGFAQQFPELQNVREKILVLKDYTFAQADNDYVKKELHKYVQTINGQTFSEMAMQPGETQLWRITNQDSDHVFNLVLQGHKFRIIGRDGRVALHEDIQDSLKVLPGQRLEVLVDAGEAGTYDLTAPGVKTGDKPDRTLGRLDVAGEAMTPIASPITFPHRDDLREKTIDASRTITFSQQYDAVIDDMHYFLNGKPFDHDRIDTRVPLGNIEEWTLKNDSDEMHEFHIHQVSFQVVAINGAPQPFDGYVDTVRIPERGEAKIRIAFTDPAIIGQFVYHCHVLEHEDKGMMAQIEVYDPKTSWLQQRWRSLFTCCSSTKFNGGCFWYSLRRTYYELLAQAGVG